jgi:hypothetical protein
VSRNGERPLALCSSTGGTSVWPRSSDTSPESFKIIFLVAAYRSGMPI